MNQNEMIQSVRAEIGKLQRVLDLLLDQSGPQAVGRTGGPKASGDRATSFNPEEFAPNKRVMSAEGKARIAAAQKKRWAKQRDSASGRSTRSGTAAAKRTSETSGSESARNVAVAKAKKSTAAGKKTSSRGVKTRVAPAKSTAVVKKSAGKKSVAKRASKSTTKRSAKQAAPVPA